jgi:hypothetical protein
MQWIGWIVGLVATAALAAVLVRRRRPSGPRTHIEASIESMRAVGELVAFKIIAKEIVTASDHWLKEFGQKYLRWLLSEKKVAVIFEFEIDFRYDLRSNAFRVEVAPGGPARILMPPCRFEISLKGQKYYDEAEAQFLPDILPKILSPGGKFSEEDRNKLFEEARKAAEQLAMDYVHSMRGEVQKSAKQTMQTMARNLGIDNARVEFLDAHPEPVGETASEALRNAPLGTKTQNQLPEVE